MWSDVSFQATCMKPNPLRKIKMKAAFFLLYLLQKLPFGILQKLADCIGYLAYYLAKKRRRIGLINLRLCFPEKNEAERIALLKKHFQHMAKLALEYGLYWYAGAEKLKSLVEYRDKYHLDNALAQGKVIILYPHFTAFELAVYTLNQDLPLISLYAHQKNPAIDARIRQGRHRYNNVFLIDRNEGLRTIIKKIKSTPQAPLLYLPDQDFGAKDSVFVEFFGIPTATITGLSRIAALTGARIVPAIPVRQNDGRVILQFYPAWDNFPGNDPITDARRMNAFIEARILEAPEQYFWLHKRFKTRPEGQTSFYA